MEGRIPRRRFTVVAVSLSTKNRRSMRCCSSALAACAPSPKSGAENPNSRDGDRAVDLTGAELGRIVVPIRPV